MTCLLLRESEQGKQTQQAGRINQVNPGWPLSACPFESLHLTTAEEPEGTRVRNAGIGPGGSYVLGKCPSLVYIATPLLTFYFETGPHQLTPG